MTILEVQPGGGWWTEILAPYARATQGEFYATAADLADPELSANAKKSRADFEARWANAAVYGKVNLVNWGAKAAPLPANKFDFVMLTRGMHGWVRQGNAEANLAKIFNAVKPGGVLAIEQHRAKPGQDPATFNGYLDENYVISLVEKAGFKLAAKVGDQRQPQGHQGSSLRRVDAAADPPVLAGRGGRQCRRPFVRSRQVRRHRRVGPHDPALREAEEVKSQ
jgi:predicted methyltransferase